MRRFNQIYCSGMDIHCASPSWERNAMIIEQKVISLKHLFYVSHDLLIFPLQALEFYYMTAHLVEVL